MKYIFAKYSFNFSLLIFLVVSGADAEIASKDTLQNAIDSVNADILFLRHALAPGFGDPANFCLLYTSPSPRDRTRSRMPSSA